MFVEIHAIQSFPPSNLNRDDTGAPKDCEFGGVRRARNSSQAWKRSIRWSEAFQSEVPHLGIRSKRVLEMLIPHLQEFTSSPEAAEVLGRAFLEGILGKLDNEGRSAVLYYYSEPELKWIADTLKEAWETVEELPAAVDEVLKAQTLEDEKQRSKKVKEATKKVADLLKETIKQFKKRHSGKASSPDIALFGRMLADSPELNVDAACQVAHAISTHRVAMDFDYFTAVDDLNPREETGAGMIGLVGFNAPCFYRYATVDMHQLLENLNGEKDLTLKTLRAFLKGFIEARPSGKQNTFAAHTLPDAIIVVIRKQSQPLSLANAFEAPVRPEAGGIVKPSIRALFDEWKDLNTMYGAEDDTEVFVCVKPSVAPDNTPGKQQENVMKLVEEVVTKVQDIINAELSA